MYKIVRVYYNQVNSGGFYRDYTTPKTIKKGLTLDEAQAHCKNPNTRVKGVYFDAYEET